MILTMQAEYALGTYTYGTGGALPQGRFGGAYRAGTVNLHRWVGAELFTERRKCSTYRKAQRKLRQWLLGYNV